MLYDKQKNEGNIVKLRWIFTSIFMIVLLSADDDFKVLEGKYNYFESLRACGTQLGSPWRVPEIWELFELRGQSKTYGKDKRFWSGNTLGEARMVEMIRHENEYFVNDKNIPAFAFYLQDGDITPTPKMIKAYLICTKQKKMLQNDDDFEKIAEGVKDSKNFLLWENEDKKRREVKLTYEAAIKYCEDLDLYGRTWRLPTLEELYGIVNYNYIKPSANKKIFGPMARKYYWTETEFGSDAAYVVGFSVGSVATSDMNNKSHFRCVSENP